MNENAENYASHDHLYASVRRRRNNVRHSLRVMARGALVLALTPSVASCFYDSTWGEAKRAQKRIAAQATPATLRRSPASDDGASEGRSLAPAKAFRMRVRATPQYAAQTVDWQKQTRELVDDANQILAPSVGVRLDVESMVAWSPPAGAKESDLDATLVALRAADAGGDVDWVAAMVGGIPKQTAAFHELGIAEVLGKHLVVRAALDANEHDVIEKGFDELSDDGRAKLRKDRKRHRALAIFLHEIGHTLGALHEIGEASVMFPAYRTTMAGFSPDASALMRIAVAHRRDEGVTSLAKERLAYLESASSSPWDPALRDAEKERMRALSSPPPSTPPTTAPSASAANDAHETEAIAALSLPDRDVYQRAQEAFRANHVDVAWSTARPLFTTYPDVYAVQDFRCQLAAVRHLEVAKLKEECARMAALSAGAKH